MSCAVVSRAALGRLARKDILRGNGAALLGDDGIGLIVGTTEARISAINVGPELRDAVPGGKGGDIDEMHRDGPRQLNVELLTTVHLFIKTYCQVTVFRQQLIAVSSG